MASSLWRTRTRASSQRSGELSSKPVGGTGCGIWRSASEAFRIGQSHARHPPSPHRCPVC
eukprot:4060698-Lingulodinium_polyedra.AAC.1